MNHMEQSLEARLAQETRSREIDYLFASGDYEALLTMAHLLNTAFSQQLIINKWIAHEAAENLGEAWDRSRNWIDR